MPHEEKKEPKRKTIRLPKKGGLGFWGFGHCQGSRGIGEAMADIYDIDVIFDDIPDVTEDEKQSTRPRRTRTRRRNARKRDQNEDSEP